MNTASKLLATAALIAVAIPTAGSARPCDHDAAPAPAPYYGETYAPPAPAPAPWREDESYRSRERSRERAAIRFERARLEETRARFYARWGWNARKVDRFERWYAVERAELDRRENALGWYASR